MMPYETTWHCLETLRLENEALVSEQRYCQRGSERGRGHEWPKGDTARQDEEEQDTAREDGTFKIMSPNSETIVDSEIEGRFVNNI